MTSLRTAAVPVVTASAVLALAGLGAGPAFAHGSMTDPVSRVAACYAEGPESPESAACKAVVAAGGTQPLYDWNGVNIANAGGRSKQIIPDGKLCSAGNATYRGLDLARADWPASKMASGEHTFHYKGTAPHKGSFELYVTKDGYDPAKPLKWSDLEAKPFVTVTDPGMVNGDYVFKGTVPKKSGRHLIYSIWQRSDSPEAFYTCSDVVFGADTGSKGPAAPTAAAPTDAPTGGHSGHGGHASNSAAPTSQAPASPAPATSAPASGAESGSAGSGSGGPAGSGSTSGSGGVELAETGGDAATTYLAVGGAVVLGAGAAVLFATARRRSAR
ncbi:lytic polysaccharide monooxygenase [Streptomyces showdoensis]|uniref:Chitin-binding protein n=1 Tax=Streptomyces showdoensis TaxID=68268 RepID=A0A2P2GLU5_STREW|nr:lytic polysaccharide monooxygenase [Streptomyces showdoensis]KKZ71819.1 chitin-binding protein [Streptomyces showdoensis]